MKYVNPTPDDTIRFSHYAAFNPNNIRMRNMTVIAEGAPELVCCKSTPVPELAISGTEVGIALPGVESWRHPT
jgi:hypothetical protein